MPWSSWRRDAASGLELFRRAIPLANCASHGHNFLVAILVLDLQSIGSRENRLSSESLKDTLLFAPHLWSERLLTLGSAARFLAREELSDRETDVASDLPQKGRGDVSGPMEGNGRRATVSMAELLVRSALPDLHEPEPLEQRDHLARSQNGGRPHRYAT